MFIEIAEVRINTEHIVTYTLKGTLIQIQSSLGDDYPIYLDHNTEEKAKLTLYALDRAIGVKPIIVRK